MKTVCVVSFKAEVQHIHTLNCQYLRCETYFNPHNLSTHPPLCKTYSTCVLYVLLFYIIGYLDSEGHSKAWCVSSAGSREKTVLPHMDINSQ